MFRKTMGVLFVCFLSLNAYAQDKEQVDSRGLQGEELVSVAVSPVDGNVIFVGTQKGLYKRNLKSDDSWKLISGLASGSCRVNQILFEADGKNAYIATDRGLYLLKGDYSSCQNIFSKSDSLEKDCLSVAVLKDGTIFIGTKGGVFYKNNQTEDWPKINSPFNNEEMVYLYTGDNAVYAAVGTGVYKSIDSGKSWEKVFTTYSQRESDNNSSNVETSDPEKRNLAIRFITGDIANTAIVYLGTTQGIFRTEDGGKNWNCLPLAGLDLADPRSVFVNDNKIYAVVKSGVYELKIDKWEQVITAFDCKQIVQSGQKIILITSKDIFEYLLSGKSDNKNFKNMSTEQILNSFNNEPTIEEVQQMAINYAEVSDKKIKDWRKRASVKAFMPKVSVGFNNNVYGTSSGVFAVGPEDWDVNFSWDLSDLVYNSEQTSIDTRSKLMAELRNDILAEATRIYFDRRKLQIELMSKESDSRNDLDKQLRLAELTALLDRLTGGSFSNVLKSTQ